MYVYVINRATAVFRVSMVEVIRVECMRGD